MSNYTNQIGQFGPWDGIPAGIPKKDSSGIVSGIISILGTVLGAVLPKKQSSIEPTTQAPTPIPQQSAFGGTTTILIAVVALVLFLKK